MKIIQEGIPFEESSIIIGEVKNKLSRYFESNMVDESIFPARIRYCLQKIRSDYRPVCWEVLEIQNGKAKLPDNFDKLCLALGCFQYQYTEPSKAVHTQEYHVCELDLCQTKCDVCHDECGNMFQIVQKNEFTTHTFSNFELLGPSKKSIPYCQEGCFNFRTSANNTYHIRDKELHIDVEDGSMVYIEYVSSLETDEGYLVPTNQTIQEWIKADLIHEVFQTLYWNGETDIQQRYQDSKQDLTIKAENAKVVYRTQEYQKFYELSNRLIRRYNKLRYAIWDNRRTTDLSRRFS